MRMHPRLVGGKVEQGLIVAGMGEDFAKRLVPAIKAALQGTVELKEFPQLQQV